MAFAYTTSATGAGTVSCTGTTTVTGSGTTFATVTGVAAGANHARVGGTITVGGNTRTIVAIASTTSLTVDSAFPSFTNQAFTVQTGIIQTGTDTMNLSLGSATGISITNRADLYRIFDVRGCDLSINGTLTVDTTVAQLRNDGSCNNTFVVNGSVSGGEIIFDGRKAAANNAPFPYSGFDWLGTNGLKILYLTGTDAYPGKFRLKDACVRFGADWLTTYSIHRSVISTEGSNCWILCGKGTGTGQPRIRQDNVQASIDFQATKTWVGVWMNFGVAQTSLSGYTPIDTDGPEINASIISVSPRIQIPNYDTTYVKAAYYVGSQITLYAGAWVNLKGNLKGTDIVWYSQAVSGGTYNVIEYSKQIKAISKDALGNVLNDGYFYFKPQGSNVSGIRARGGTSDITFDLSQKNILISGGFAETEFIYAWDYANTNGLKSLPQFFCSGQTKGAETHLAFLSRYGYDKQPVTLSLSGNNTFEVSASHASLPTSSKVIATAQAITGVTFDFVNKTMNITGNLTNQQIYDAYQYALNIIANLFQADDCITTGGTSNYVGWAIVVNTGVIVSTGTGNFSKLQAQNIKIVDLSVMPYLFNVGGILQEIGVLLPSTVLGLQDTYTGAGAITGVYQNINGTSTTLQISVPSAGYSICIYKADGTTKYFANNLAAGNYFYYFMPSEAGTYLFAAENYGQKRTEETFILNGGNVAYSIVNQEDVGITDTKTAASAYTTLATTSQLYDATALFRLSEAGIKLGQIATRDGFYLDFGNYNVKIKDDASAIVSVATGTVTYKSIVINESLKYNAMKATPPATITLTDNEIISVLIEDANGDSRVGVLGGDNIGYQLWKVPTATATDDYATGTLLATLATNALPYRFIGISGFDIVGRDVSSGVRRRTSMLKGVYNQAFYVGDQIQLSTDAPQLIENNEKLSEVILKLDAKLDVAVSTRLEGSAYTNAPTTSQIWNAPTRTLTSAGASGATLAEIEASTILAKEATSQSVKTKVDSLNNADFTTTNNKIDAVKTKVDTLSNYNDAALVAKVDGKPSLYDMEGSTVLAKEGTSQNIKNKVDSLSNYDDAALVAKVDAKPSLSQIEGSTVLAKESTSQSVKAKVDTLSNTDLTVVNQDLTKIKQGINDASLLIPTNLT